MTLAPRDFAREDPGAGCPADAGTLFRELTGLTEPQDPARMRGFALRLGDGSRWWIAGSPQASFIAEKLGAIMRLTAGDPGDSRLLFFYDKDRDRGNLALPRLRGQGWTNLYDFYQILFHPGLHHAVCENDASQGDYLYLLMSCATNVIHWESIGRGGLPFHAALLEYQGQAVILAASGGTGKSTCSRRVPPPWRAWCDDEVLAVLSSDGRYLTHPFPTWTDYLWKRADNTWKVEDNLPLAGLFFIEQAPEDEVIPLPGGQAAVAATRSAGEIMLLPFLFDADSRDSRELRQNIFDNACDFIKKVPAFRLRVSLTGRFWEKIEAALGWR
jgi:SynChlorMet cassette protein ScmC